MVRFNESEFAASRTASFRVVRKESPTVMERSDRSPVELGLLHDVNSGR